MRLLLTGFEPFSDYERNISWDIAQLVALSPIENVDICLALLPVSFNRVGNCLKSLIDDYIPDAILMLGQSTTRSNIEIERIAVNLMYSINGDNDGYCPIDEPIIVNSENAYFSNAPLRKIVESCKQHGIDIKISNSAGLFVCNCCFYHALHLLKNQNCVVAFIHLPANKNLTDFNNRHAVELIIKSLIDTCH